MDWRFLIGTSIAVASFIAGGVWALVHIAFRVGGEAREIRLLLTQHGPRLDKLETDREDHRGTMSRIETQLAVIEAQLDGVAPDKRPRRP